MRKLFFASLILGGSAFAQTSLDANSIVVTAVKTVVLAPTDATFMLTVSADFSFTLDQVLAALDSGLTAQDLVAINSYPIAPYPPVTTGSRVNYTFRLNVPLAKMKDTIDKLEKLRKSLDTGMDLSYTASSVGPTQAAVKDAHDKALPELIADAQKRAQTLAAAAQLKLGAIQAVNEPYSFTDGSAPSYGPSLSFTVTVRFAAQ